MIFSGPATSFMCVGALVRVQTITFELWPRLLGHWFTSTLNQVQQSRS